MLLLHPKKKASRQHNLSKPQKPAKQAKMLAAGRALVSGGRASSAPLCVDQWLVKQPNYDVVKHAGTDITGRKPYLSSVVRCQASPRVRRKETAVMVGGVSGVLGLVWGLLAGPFFPVVGAGAALVGAAVGAAVPVKEPASFQQVRKHMFHKSGIVDSRRASSALVAALKKAKVVSDGRTRNLLRLDHLDAAFKMQPQLSAKQRRRVRESLQLIATEAPHFDALTREQQRLNFAISQSTRRPLGAPRDLDLNAPALRSRLAEVERRLAGKPRLAGPQHPRAAANMPQHMTIVANQAGATERPSQPLAVHP